MKNLNLFLGMAILIFILVIGYWALTPNTAPSWTGFGPYDEQSQGPRSKTMWDWLDLLVVPIFLAIGGYLLSIFQKESEKKIELDRQRQNALNSYVAQISSLLLEKRLRTSKMGSEVRSLARTYTRIALGNLDSNRKAGVLQFLIESELIGKDPIISLEGADLTNSNLSNARLVGAEIKGARFANSTLKDANLYDSNLCGCNFSNSIFDGASLEGTDLSYTILKGAKLRNTDLTKTNLEWANLENADLSNTIITMEQIKKLDSTRGAKLPHTFKAS
jgi:uncharacterized protein YjbI with pentapeptide repeats